MSRLKAISVLKALLSNKKPLQEALDRYTKEKDFPFLSELCFGVARYYHQLSFILNHLLSKPLKNKDLDIMLLLLLGLYELNYLKTPSFAAVDETVKVTKKLKKPWASSLVNGVLRQFLREKESIISSLSNDEVYLYAHPDWLIKKIKKDYPERYHSILLANNNRPPLTLRVNATKTTKEKYYQILLDAGLNVEAVDYLDNALLIHEKVNVTSLPFFKEGYFSIQDIAPQFTKSLLDLSSHQRILDACSAPGGKLTHILESNIEFDKVLAIDNKQYRINKMQSNLLRLGLNAEVKKGDAAEPASWWDGELFDSILLDAPCSATGIIRRHPDIKILRTFDAVIDVAKTQKNILNALWPLLKKDGRLLYATCSILKKENDDQMHAFLTSHPDAKSDAINLPIGQKTSYGWQLLPPDSDGFYYACLKKTT